MSASPPVTAYTLTLNEARQIRPVLESLKWADEIIVVDSFSTDGTPEIAREYNARVLSEKFCGFGKLRNRALVAAKNDWIFSLDADERCTPAFAEALRRELETPKCAAYFVPRLNHFLGRPVRFGGFYPDYRQPQVFDRRRFEYRDDLVHEGFDCKGAIGHFQEPILQHPFPTMDVVMAKTDRYTTLMAQRYFAEGRRTGIGKMAWHPLGGFLKKFVAQQGFREGICGFMLAGLHAYYTFLKYAKLWELQHPEGISFVASEIANRMMTADVDLSAIIVTRNTCKLACAAVESVLSSRDDLSKEVLLVDNGSTDETQQVVSRDFPAVRYLRSESNLGYPRASNWAGREAKGRFLLLLNSDAALPPDGLSSAVNWMRAHPDCGACGAQLLNPDGSRQNSIANFPTLATEMINKSLLRRLWPSRFPGKEQVFAEPLEVQSVVGAFFLTRKDLWDKLGGLDEDYFFFLEETDFCFRVRKAGLRVMHLPQVQVRHEQGGSAGGMRAAARIEYWRSRYLYFRKHHGPGVRLALQIGLAGRLLIDTLVSGLMTLLSFGGSERWRQKFASYRALVAWHLQGRPANRGLPR